MERRPQYVSDEDERLEMAVAFVLKRRFDLDSVVKNPRFFPMDLSLMRGSRVIGFAEVKSRYFPSTKYDEVFLSVARAINMANFAAVSGRPVILVWNFSDKMLGLSIRDGWHAPWPIAMGGRTDRDDSEDIEPIFLVPVRELKEVDTGRQL